MIRIKNAVLRTLAISKTIGMKVLLVRGITDEAKIVLHLTTIEQDKSFSHCFF